MQVTFLALALVQLTLQPLEPERLEKSGYQQTQAGNYRYRIEHSRDGIGETPIASFALSDRSDRLLVRLERPGEDDFLVSDAGWFVGVMAIPGNCHLTFYDIQGRALARREFSRSFNYGFSPSGNRLYVNTREGLLAYDAQGRVVAQCGAGSWFLVSPDERLVAVVQADLISVFSADFADYTDSNLRKSVQSVDRFHFRLGSLLFRDLAFSEDGQFLAVVERSTVSLYSLGTVPEFSLRKPGTVSSISRLWRQELDPGTSLLRVAVSSDGAVYVGGEQGSVADSGFLSVLRDGKEVTRAGIPYFARNEGLVSVAVEGKEVIVKTSDHSFIVRGMP